MSATPRTWSEVFDRLARVFGGPEGEARAAAEEWVAESIDRYWGFHDLRDLPRTRRQIALQRTIGVTLALEEQGELAFAVDLRTIVAASFARYWKGIALDGPPWRLDPYENRPTYAEWLHAEVAV